MKLELFNNLPSIVGELVAVSPVTVKATESFEEARQKLDGLASTTGELSLSIQTDLQYAHGLELLQELNRLRASFKANLDASEVELDQGKEKLARYRQQLESPLFEIVTGLRAETSRFWREKENLAQQAEEAQRLKAEAIRDKNQRENDMMKLREELAGARHVADRSERFGEKETAKEIRKALQRFYTLDTAPDSYVKPLKDATEIRSIVALALQREQERIKVKETK